MMRWDVKLITFLALYKEFVDLLLIYLIGTALKTPFFRPG
jgi:hypothetical protein